MKPSGTGVRRVQHRPETLLADVSVVLRRRQIRMSEHLLHGAEIGTSVEQVGREGVTQRVRVRRRQRAAVEEPVDVTRTEGIAPPVEEDDLGR